ncbi:condensation domain-containing protein [Novosphingobium aquiterrae]|uniref:Condensation domain-containing protein n=1 Tax=Novosphingobium aquiterrae TaxID=624388 RepID=A0ABV6PEH3_9SPHN
MTWGDRSVAGERLAATNDDVVGRFPATANQHACWHLATGRALGSALHAAFCRRIEGRISDTGAETALQGLVDRHEILRTRFRLMDEGRLVQEVLRRVRIKPVQVDLRHLPEAMRAAELDRLGKAVATEPFQFTDSESPVPLVRVLLVRMAHDLAFMHIVFHQLVIDGWSVELLIDEFGRLAQAHDAGQNAGLEPPELHFGDYANWQQDLLADAAIEAERDYWRGKLADLPYFTVKPDRPNAVRDGKGEIRSILLPSQISEGFEALARLRSHTPFSLSAATAAAALYRLSGRPEVVFGTQLAGREDSGSEAIVGPLLNTVLVRHSVAIDETFFGFADRLRETSLEAMQHGLLPFSEVVRTARGKLHADAIDNYCVNLVVQRCNISSGSVGRKDFGAFRIDSRPGQSTGAQRDLSLFMVSREEGWRISCEAASALYDTATIDRLLAAWLGVIEAVVADPEVNLSDVANPLVPEEPTVATQHAPPTAPAPQPRNKRIEDLRSRITMLQARGTGVPVIALNSSSVLYPVAQAIGTNNPFIDIQFCPSSVRTTLPQRHFSDHARDAVEMIRLARPHGPYALFGLCIFGAVALEAARILREEGEEVPLVILNDTYRPGFREGLGLLDRTLRRWQVSWRTFRDLRQRFNAGEITGAEWIDNYRITRKLRISRVLRRLGLIADTAVRDVLQDHNRWFPEEVLRPSQANFEMKPYPGRVVLFRNTAMREGRLFPRDFGWKGFVSNKFLVVDCPGTHDTMFRSAGAAVIGDVVCRALAEKETELGFGT